MKWSSTIALSLAILGCLPASLAAVIREDFASEPTGRGWQVRGDASHFVWNSARASLAVTWDSKRDNAFFLRPLPAVLTRTDDFHFRFSLTVDAIQTETPDTTFQIALGLVRQRDAFASNSFRGAGIHPTWGPRNLIEFDYFPASQVIAPTFSAVAVGTNNARWAYLDLFPFALETGRLYTVEVRHKAADASLSLTVLQDGLPFAQGLTHIDARFGDFRVDAFSITSYSGEHQPANYGGNVLAQGWIDDLEIELPDPPFVTIAALDAGFPFRVALDAVPGWTPILERRTDGGAWTDLDLLPESSGNRWQLTDPQPPATAALYRVRLERP